MKRTGFASGVLAAAMAAVLTGCAGAQKEEPVMPPGAGHLVIAGGAVKEDNAAIFGRMVTLAGADGQIGVLPTASGVPLESGPGAVGDFEKHGAPGRAAVIDITTTNAAEAANPEKAKEIESKKAIWFTGGDQSRIIAAFRPDSGDTVGYQALKAVLAGGGAIGGSSAGAAMMSDPCIRWGNSTDALLIGASEAEDAGVGIGRGMGFFPYGITDQHFLRRGRLGRLIVALDHTKTKYGFGVEENSAMAVDLATHTIEAVGPRALVFVDMSEATRTDMGLSDIRVSLLGDGDVVNGATGEVTPASSKLPVVVTRSVAEIDKYRSDATKKDGDKLQFDIWESQVVVDRLRELAVGGSRKVTASDGNFDILFVRDEETAFFSSTPMAAGDPDLREKNFTAVRVLMYIVPRPSAKPEAERLRAKLAEKK